jgi:pyruvate/2-oxoglutarate dehydrogenase complex dihydrolipoamide acyltransferase (E2) component
MKPVVVPTPDVNSESGVVVEWLCSDREPVEANALLVEIETSKAVLEVTAPEAGYLLHLVRQGAEVSLTAPVALLFPDLSALTEYEDKQKAAAADAATGTGPRATVKAIARARELGIDLSTVDTPGLITVKEVEAAAAAAAPVDYGALPLPLSAPDGAQRVLIIGAGRGATQVIDIFASTGQRAVGIIDDDRAKWGDEIWGLPVVGGADRLALLYEQKTFDAVVIAISTSVVARTKFREACEKAGVPLANAIDPTARIATDVTMGTGNVICAFVHFGTGTVVGDNNFISAYNSFDHHSVLANDISTGPGCMTSGRATLGNRVRLGTGIFMEPGLELGDDVQVASGSVILRSVPADHVVKTKIVTTTVVPRRR